MVRNLYREGFIKLMSWLEAKSTPIRDSDERKGHSPKENGDASKFQKHEKNEFLISHGFVGKNTNYKETKYLLFSNLSLSQGRLKV